MQCGVRHRPILTRGDPSSSTKSKHVGNLCERKRGASRQEGLDHWGLKSTERGGAALHCEGRTCVYPPNPRLRAAVRACWRPSCNDPRCLPGCGSHAVPDRVEVRPEATAAVRTQATGRARWAPARGIRGCPGGGGVRAGRRWVRQCARAAWAKWLLGLSGRGSRIGEIGTFCGKWIRSVLKKFHLLVLVGNIPKSAIAAAKLLIRAPSPR